MELILHKSLQSARASALYSYLCGGLSAAGAIGAWFYLPSPFLIWFCAGCTAPSSSHQASGMAGSRVKMIQPNKTGSKNDL